MATIISLVLRAKENDLLEFHASQLGKRLYPCRAGGLVGFWSSMEDATRELAASPLILPLMTMFDVCFASMDEIHADLAGKPLAVVDMTTEPPHLPFDLVYEVSPGDAALFASGTGLPPPAAASAAPRRG